jgi:hypothetical protein
MDMGTRLVEGDGLQCLSLLRNRHLLSFLFCLDVVQRTKRRH